MRTAAHRILDLSLLAAALAVAVFTLYLCWTGYSAAPFADGWAVLFSYADAGFHVTPGWLLGFHNEHRPLFARLPILADLLWAGGGSLIPFGLIILAQSAQALLLWWIAGKQPWFEERHRVTMMAWAVFCCFSFAQIENFVWAFQIAFVLNFVFATAAWVGLALQKERQSPYWSALVFLGGFGAPLCLASGLLVWWIAVAMAIAIRLPRKWIAIYAFAGAVTSLLYAQGYSRPANHMGPLQALQRPADLAQYVAIYLGYSWKQWSVVLGELLAAGATLLLGVRVVGLFRTEPRNPWEAAPAAVMLFAWGTGFLCALGRLNFGLEQAQSSRYQTPALLFWYAAALLAFAALSRYSIHWTAGLSTILFVTMALTFKEMPSVLDGIRARRSAADETEAAWVSGVSDERLFAWNQLRLHAPYRERRLGLFSVSPGSEMGTIVNAGRIQDACEGHFDRDAAFFHPQWPGIRLRSSASVNRFIVVGADGRVVGVGVHNVAYAAVKNPSETVTVYGLLSGGKLCSVPAR